MPHSPPIPRLAIARKTINSQMMLSALRGVSSSQVIHSSLGGGTGLLGFFFDAFAKLNDSKVTKKVDVKVSKR